MALTAIPVGFVAGLFGIGGGFQQGVSIPFSQLTECTGSCLNTCQPIWLSAAADVIPAADRTLEVADPHPMQPGIRKPDFFGLTPSAIYYDQSVYRYGIHALV